MLSSNQRSAIAALDAARPVVARLDVARHPDDVAADVIESWSAVETALRALLGSSGLSGQALVSEVRQRGLLDYVHAHALLGFLAARDRVSRTDYRPTESDVDATRSGFQAVEAALGVGIGADTATYPTVGTSGGGFGVPPMTPPPRNPTLGNPSPAAAARHAPPVGAAPPATTYTPESAARRRGPGLMIAIVAVVLLAAVGAWALMRGRSSALDRGIDEFRQGNRVAARRDFEQAATDLPKLATPHIYLGRMARDDRDMSRAFDEYRKAITLEPNNPIALREMGQYLLLAGQPDQATKWFERALRVNANDKVAAGWMGCALQREGRADIAARFFQRAGTGDWTACQQTAPPYPAGVAPGAVPPGALPPGAMVPGAVPPGATAPPTAAPAVPRP
jgi:tetratricopeptide (TPR) repeat protein